MRAKSFTGTLAALAAVSLALTACSGTAGGGASEVPKESLEVGKSQINPQPASEIEEGGTLRLALSQIPEQWNYYQTDGSLLDASTVLKTSMPRAFRFDENNEAVIDTNYVTKAELTETEPQTVEYTINEKATWNDGTPITWVDFEAVWKANTGENEEFIAGDPTGYQDIESVTKGATDKDVKVVFKQHFGDWKKLFTFIYPASYYATADDYNTGWLDTIPTSAGPFVLDVSSIDKSAQTITLKRNDKWWGEKPHLDSIIFRALDGNADIDAYLNNELDIVAAGSNTRYSRVKDAPNSDFRVAPSNQYNHITFGSGGVLADPETRVGVQQAINRQALADTLYNGIPFDVKLLNNHMFVNTDADYKDNAKGVVDYSVESAAKTLDDAGWKVEGDVRVKDGKKLTPRLVIPAANPTSQQIAELIQAQLAAVQVKLTIDAVPSETFFRDNITPGNFDMTIFSWASTGFLADSVSIFQLGSNTQNYGKISTPEITKILDEANSELDAAKLADLTNEADALVWKDGHSLPIAQAPKLTVSSPKLANYGAFAANYDPVWTAVGWVK